MRKNDPIAIALAALLLPALTACRDRQTSIEVASAEIAAVAHLHALFTAEAAYNATNNHFACTIAELAASPGLIDSKMATGQQDGYVFSVHCPQQIELPAYQVWATPLQPGETGVNLYCTDQTGIVRRNDRLLDTCNKGKPVE